jgi:type IV secretion system protein VirB10
MTEPGKSQGGHEKDKEKSSPHSPLFADDSGVKRFGWMFGLKIILFTLSAACAVLFFVLLAANSVPTAGEQVKSERNANMSDPLKLQDELIAAAEASKHGKVQVIERIAEGTPPNVAVAPPAHVNASPASGSKVIVIQAPAPRRAKSLTNEEREAARRYRDMKQESLLSKSAVNSFGDWDKDRESGAPALSREQLMLKMLENSVNGKQGEGTMSQDTNDTNAWRHKLDFLTQDGASRTPQDYSHSPNTRNAPLAPMELKAGAVIPGLLLVGVNSDLPGILIGQVSENVYDTATGRYLLIPQGTRIVGVYDSRITHGQKRVAVVWNRLIYPDGSSLDIAGSPGTDIAGISGIKGRVDNHYGQLLTAALFTSVFTAAADIAGGGDAGDSDRKSAKDVLVETTGTVSANTGARLAERALDIQPTITVRPGTRFNVMVTRDVAFLSPWK